MIIQFTGKNPGLLMHLSFFLIFLCSVSNTLAKDYTTHNTIDIYGNTVTYPMASWQKSATLKSINEKNKDSGLPFKSFRDQSGNYFIFEMIPQNEEFSDWRNLYAITGEIIPCSFPVDIPILASFSREPFKKYCQRFIHTSEPVSTSPHKAIIETYFCENINGSSEGEIAIKFIALTPNNTSIQVYQEWKTEHLKIKDESTWPVTKQALNDMRQQLKKIQIQTTSKPCPEVAKKRN